MKTETETKVARRTTSGPTVRDALVHRRAKTKLADLEKQIDLADSYGGPELGSTAKLRSMAEVLREILR